MSAVSAKNSLSPVERYRAAFDARWRNDDALTSLRRAALDQFLSMGFPTQRHEEWKYTSLRRLETRNFAPSDKSSLSSVIDSKQDLWIKDAGSRIVLVNGHWMPSLSSQRAQPPGITVLTLGQWLEHDADEVASFLAQARATESSALEHLNAAFFEDGVVVNLGDDARLDEPLYIVHQWNESASQRMSHPRLIVRAGRNSRCVIVEQFLGPADAEYFTNAVATIDVAAGAAVSHYRLQQESTKSFHIGRINVRQQSDSRYSCHDVALGASLGRVNIVTLLEGAGAHAALHGLFVPMGTQHLDTHTRIEHVAPHTTSEEDYRGVAAGRGRGVFNGKVIVRPDAQKIDARQSSRNLLLSATAEIDTKPELEIYANDVKCSHGATTGQLDATALFYLRSRGLSEMEARALLIRAFAESILTSIEHAPVRSYLEHQLNSRFAVSSEVHS
jgi:Fe-S cluster assembly protein SufD